MNKIKEEIDRLADKNEYIIIDVPLPNEDFINFTRFDWFFKNNVYELI